jgi:hypothetical protein
MSRPKNFAKLYSHRKLGQVLVVLDATAEDDGLEVTYSYVPDGLGVCSVGVEFRPGGGYKTQEEAAAGARDNFESVTEESAFKIIEATDKRIQESRLVSAQPEDDTDDDGHYLGGESVG